MIVSCHLEPGDTIGIVAPASPFAPGELDDGINYFRKKGFEVRLGKAVFSRRRFLAGSDKERADDLMEFFANSGVKAIFTAGGGYGSMRLLDMLDYELIRSNPKPFLGFSDTTALQLAFLTRSCLISYSGITLVRSFKDGHLDPIVETSLRKALANEPQCFENLEVCNPADFQGPLIGGCLTLVTGLLGTDYLPQVDGAVLLLEEVREQPYRVDRMFAQLRLAGVFKRISALVLGRFVDCFSRDPSDGTIEDVIRELMDSVDIPVIKEVPYGHGHGCNILPIGGRVVFSADSRQLKIEASALLFSK